MVVRAGGLEPPRAEPDGFSYLLRLSPPLVETSVWGLDYPFTMPIGCPVGLGAARLVSTPSVVSYGLARDYQLKGFPEFEQFYFGDFPPSTQFGLSPLRLPFRHARTPRGVIGRKFS